MNLNTINVSKLHPCKKKQTILVNSNKHATKPNQ